MNDIYRSPLAMDGKDPTNLRGNRGVSGFDVPQRIVVTHVWELPWGKNLSSPLLKRIASGCMPAS